MNKLLLIVCILCCNRICFSQTILNPVFDRTDSYEFHIDKIEQTLTNTELFCSVSVPDNSWINISPNTYIEDNLTKEKYTILNSEGIPFSPLERSFDRAMRCEVKLIFPKLQNCRVFNLIERDGGRGFNIYGVNLERSFERTYTTLDYEHFSQMADFWMSSDNKEKTMEAVLGELSASRYLFGIKSILSISKMFELSDLYLQSGDVEKSLEYKTLPASICQDICSMLIQKKNQRVSDDYYLQDLDWFCEKQTLSLRYLFERKQWHEAKLLSKDVLDILSERNDTTFYIPIIQYFVGYSAYYLKDEEDAERYFILSYNSFQKYPIAKQYSIYGELLNMLSILYSDWGAGDKAYQYALESCEVNKKVCGDHSKEYGFALIALSNAELMLNKKEEGCAHAELASEIIEKSDDVSLDLKNVNFERINFVRNFTKGDANVAQSQVLEKDTSNNVTLLLFEANNDALSGNLGATIMKLSHIKNLMETNFESVELHNYIRTIVTLSDALSLAGHLEDADKILDEAIGNLNKYSVKSKQIRHLYASKGLLYYMLNDTRNSTWWYKQALDLFDHVNDHSISYARLLSNLSLLYLKDGLYDLAKEKLDEAYDISNHFYSKDFENSYDYYMLLNNIAVNYAKMKDYSKGKEIYNMIIQNATSQSKRSVKALAMSNLAEIYILSKDFETGRKILEDALSLDVDGYIKEMIDINILFSLLLEGNSSVVEKLKCFNKDRKEKFAKIFGHFSESEREQYWYQWSSAMAFLNNWVVSKFDTNETRQMAYDVALFTKSMLIKSSRLFDDLVKNCDDKVNDMFLSMMQYKTKLSVRELPSDSIDSYKKAISQIEKELISIIPKFDEKLTSRFKSYLDVKNLLLENDIAIEFVFIPEVKMPIEDTKMSYGALILSKCDVSPIFVPLCTEDDLKEILFINDSVEQISPDILYSISNKTLYEMIWKKIEPYIPNGTNVFYSPVGYLNRINFTAISDGQQRISEKCNIYEVSSTANIGREENLRKRKDYNIVIYGNVNYNEDIEMMKRLSYSYKSYSPGILLAKRSPTRGSWDLLPETKVEIDSICDIVKNCSKSILVFSKDNANEESFKAFNGNSPTIIHIATHGFYLPNKMETHANYLRSIGTNTIGDRHMQYSGLLFAGANNVWSGKTLAPGVEDGILTAEEISRLDLSNTDIVVLSACDTGLGDISKIDGVYGLQRGFKRAGVESVLMSLWKVDDRATRILMVEFYRNLMNGKTKLQSLKEAQQYLRKVDNGKYDDPKFWASFIMLDGLN